MPALLRRLLHGALSGAPPPKSTGRELFNRAWLRAALDGLDCRARRSCSPRCANTPRPRIAAAIACIAGARPAELLVCGGGACNTRADAPPGGATARHAACATPAQRGIAPEHVEAAAFAWLAHQFLEGQPGNLVAVTGARGPRVLGALHRGRRNGTVTCA